MALTMVTVTGTLMHPDNATPMSGSLIFTPSAGPVYSGANSRVVGGPMKVTLSAQGTFSIQLVATDQANITPAANTWDWKVSFEIYDAALPSFHFALPSSPSTVDISALTQLAS
jgi:hypothetical protein